MSDPVFLSEAQIVAIHARQIDLFGGLHGIRDINLLSSSVLQPQNACFYGGKTSFFDLAAEYAFSLAKNHAFHDGNKRTAAASVIVFLDLNGQIIEEDFTQPVLALVTGEINKADFSAILEKACKPKVIDLIAALQKLIKGD